VDLGEMKYAIRSWKKNFHADEKHAVFGRQHSPIRITVTKNCISKYDAGSSLEIVPVGERG
jgi:hypothetical protein